MRVLIADDHALIRAGLRALLLNIPGIHEVLEAGDGHEAVQIVARHKPEVVLMDIAMPGMNGLQAMSHLRENVPT
jgi:DNA-binding NarL/FixJ family response regulator